MKVTMKLTLDDLLRALRRKVHAMAEDAETGYVRPRPGAEAAARAETGREGSDAR